MVDSFNKRWEKGDEPSLATRVRETVRSPGPLKPRIDAAAKRVELQIQMLDKTSARFNERDKSIFNKVVDAYTKHDSAHANVYANELAEIRRMEKVTMSARLALDQIVLRLQTVSELGDVAHALLPVIGVVREVKNGMSSVSPQIGKELGDISNLLSGIVLDAGAVTGMSISFESSNEDAQKIMMEAATVAESRMKDTFPELPGKASVGQPLTDRT
jgi:division protein CdvB (Snf7/Vps24/ESCRT-III family)